MVFEVSDGLIFCPFIFLCHRIYLWLEVLLKLLLRNAANAFNFSVEADVHQVVERREKGDLREFGYSCDEDETNVLVVGFEDGEDLAVGRRALVMLGCAP